MEVAGFHSFWGLSPSFNMIECMESHGEVVGSDFKFCLVQPGDVRHILHTMTHRMISDDHQNSSIEV